MPAKVDFKREDKHIYKPSSKKPSVIEMQTMKYLMIDGMGAPDGEAFQKAIKALYKIAYAIRMSHKKGLEPEGYYEYVVPPLEGIWDIMEGTEYDPGDKTNFKWTLLIRQPEFVTQAFFEKMKGHAIEKDDNDALASVRLESQSDGLSCHMTHIGPFDDEPVSFEIMEKWAQENGYRRISKTHREIYLSDFNKTAPEKLKTVLRFKVEPVDESPGGI